MKGYISSWKEVTCGAGLIPSHLYNLIRRQDLGGSPLLYFLVEKKLNHFINSLAR